MGIFSDVAQDHDCRWAAIAKRSCDEGAATSSLCRRFEVSGKVGNPIITPITADLSPEIAALTSEIPTLSFEDLRLERFWRRDWVRNSSIGLTKLDGKEWSICFFFNDMFGVVLGGFLLRLFHASRFLYFNSYLNFFIRFPHLNLFLHFFMSGFLI